MLKPSLELLPIVFSLDNSVVVVYSGSFSRTQVLPCRCESLLQQLLTPNPNGRLPLGVVDIMSMHPRNYSDP